MCGGMDHTMKSFRIVGAVFVVFGFFFSLIGILSSLTPLIQSEHFRMILNSFQETSADPLTNTLNTIVRFCLHSSYFLLFCGISLMIAGGLISSSAHKKQLTDKKEAAPQRVSPPAAETLGIPKPAYYPGGLAPPVIKFNLGREDKEPLDFGSGDAQKAGPISGGIEPSFSSDENDAQKLMQYDQLLSSQKQEEQPTAPEYIQYLSNSVPEERTYDRGEEDDSSAKPFNGGPIGTQGKPKIVSTMRKRTF